MRLDTGKSEEFLLLTVSTAYEGDSDARNKDLNTNNETSWPSVGTPASSSVSM
jgi:hypothetical protein